MSAQELYLTIQNFILKEKIWLLKHGAQTDYTEGRWDTYKDLEDFLHTLDPEIFPDLGEDEK